MSRLGSRACLCALLLFQGLGVRKDRAAEGRMNCHSEAGRLTSEQREKTTALKEGLLWSCALEGVGEWERARQQ